jgi:acyl carrier protein
LTAKKNEIETTVIEVVARLFDVSHDQARVLERGSEDKWTSLMHVELFFALEERFGIRISDDEIAFAESTSDLIDVASRSLGEK